MCMRIEKAHYYIDRSVLMENTLLVKFIRNYVHPGPEWRIFHMLTSEDIDDVLSRFFTDCLCELSAKNGK